MRQTSTALVSIGLALAAFAAVMAPAAARPRHPHHRHHHNSVVYRETRPPLTVTKRSWLDPGPVAPVGSEESYAMEGAYFQRTPDETYFPSRFGEDYLPRPLYVPGSMYPLVEFATPRDPFSPY